MKGSKRYGRRSMPFSSDDFDCLADDEEDIDVASSTKSLKRSLTADSVTDTDEVGSVSLIREQEIFSYKRGGFPLHNDPIYLNIATIWRFPSKTSPKI